VQRLPTSASPCANLLEGFSTTRVPSLMRHLRSRFACSSQRLSLSIIHVTMINAVAFIIIVLLSFSSCSRVDSGDEGYLVIRSEQFTQHYQGSPCGSVSSEYRRSPPQTLACDVPELRFNLLHKGIKFVGTCQAWNSNNPCREMQVGATYTCKVDAESVTTPPSQWLVCANHGFLAIQSSELSR
jgi:hypothetical protein